MAEHGFALPRTGPQDTKAGNPEGLGRVREGRAAGAGEGDVRGWRSEVAPNRWGAEGPGRGGGSRERKTVRAPAETGRRGPGAGARTPGEARRLGAGGGGLPIWVSATARRAAAAGPRVLGARGRLLVGCGLRAGLWLSWRRPRAPGSSNFAVLACPALSLMGACVWGEGTGIGLVLITATSVRKC